jgi:hypothetical protein
MAKKRNEEEEEVDTSLTQAEVDRILRAYVLSSILGVVILAGGAVIVPGSRTLLLGLAVAYIIVSIPAYLFLRRSMMKRLKSAPPA